LSRRLDFRCIDGWPSGSSSASSIPRGLTALDDLNETMLGRGHHVARHARLEIENLLTTMGLGLPAASNDDVGQSRDATRP